MLTIGVAVGIPEPWASELQAYRAALGDNTAHQIPTHITLIPPTPVDQEQYAELEQHLEWIGADTQPFEVHLRGTGTFRPTSPVVFVMLARGISDCEQLAAALRAGPLPVELAFPYHPHVTIGHHLPDDVLDRAFDELARFECRFDVTEFHLYTHDESIGWEPVRSFRLGRS